MPGHHGQPLCYSVIPGSGKLAQLITITITITITTITMTIAVAIPTAVVWTRKKKSNQHAEVQRIFVFIMLYINSILFIG